MNALGRHLLLELFDCDADAINNLETVKGALVEAAKRAQATIVDVVFHEFNPFGISGVVVIAESHLSIHTWPEYRYAAVDIFSCGDVLQPQVAANYLVEQFGAERASVVELQRGMFLNATDARSSTRARSPSVDRRRSPYKWFFETTTAGRRPHARHRPDHRRAADEVPARGDHGDRAPTASAWCSTAGSSRARPTSSSTTRPSSTRACWPTDAAPSRAMVIGGGEGATLREILRYPSITDCLMVDIDGEVVEVCKKHLPEMHQGAFDDPRTELRHEDARAYLEKTDERFDLIVVDLVEPLEEGPACLLFTKEFYTLVRDRLTPRRRHDHAGRHDQGRRADFFTARSTGRSRTSSRWSRRLPELHLLLRHAVGLHPGHQEGRSPQADRAAEIDRLIAERDQGPAGYWDGHDAPALLQPAQVHPRGHRRADAASSPTPTR